MCDVILTLKMFAGVTKESNEMHEVRMKASNAVPCMMLTMNCNHIRMFCRLSEINSCKPLFIGLVLILKRVFS